MFATLFRRYRRQPRKFIHHALTPQYCARMLAEFIPAGPDRPA
jgi:hypothetical protein